MKKELSASSGMFGLATKGKSSVPRPTAKEVANGVILPLILVMLVVAAVGYAIARNIHEEANAVKSEAIKAVEQKATAGKSEILRSVEQNTKTLQRVQQDFKEHQENAMRFREKVTKKLEKEK